MKRRGDGAEWRGRVGIWRGREVKDGRTKGQEGGIEDHYYTVRHH